MGFPKTKEQLIAKGYRLERQSVCRGPNCGQMIEWWTTPNGKFVPLNPKTYQPHWSNCPDSGQLRKEQK